MNETAQIAPTFLSQHELAELLQLPERTLEDSRLTHVRPPYMQPGRHVRYDLAHVLA
ncbi:DNA-binding protein [Salinibacterium sp. ZJ454]|uniref:DNA-binding protein n=1 Tax=Salinibacterium sp. ZJ454 TaxID=2708339 RepID=UPI001420AEA0|nr:DNA-binding protein [Salinibacterium sp. ZJ454]